MHVLCLIILLSTFCVAQSRPQISGAFSGGVSAGLGYVSPTLRIETEASTSIQQHVVLLGRAAYSPRYNKFSLGDGWAYTLEGEARIYPQEAFFVGLGVNTTKAQWTAASRRGTHLRATAGLNFIDRLILSGFYDSPDHTRYHTQRAGVIAEINERLSRHLYATCKLTASYYWLKGGSGPRAETGCGLTYRF